MLYWVFEYCNQIITNVIVIRSQYKRIQREICWGIFEKLCGALYDIMRLDLLQYGIFHITIVINYKCHNILANTIEET